MAITTEYDGQLRYSVPFDIACEISTPCIRVAQGSKGVILRSVLTLEGNGITFPQDLSDSYIEILANGEKIRKTASTVGDIYIDFEIPVEALEWTGRKECRVCVVSSEATSPMYTQVIYIDVEGFSSIESSTDGSEALRVVKEKNKGRLLEFWVGTRAEYEQLEVRDTYTLYILTDDVDATTIFNKLADLQRQIDELKG